MINTNENLIDDPLIISNSFDTYSYFLSLADNTISKTQNKIKLYKDDDQSPQHLMNLYNNSYLDIKYLNTTTHKINRIIKS
jgi:hypothetical protein